MTNFDFFVGTALLIVLIAALIAVDYMEKLSAPIY